MKRLSGLRYRALLLAGVAVLPALVLVGFLAWQGYSGERQHAALSQPAVLGLALAVALMLLIAWFGAERLVARPLARVAEAADRLGAGDLSARSGLARDGGEIGRLAATLDGLAAHLQRTRRALRTLSGGNRTLLREGDEPALLAAMCRVAVETGGYPLAFVCYARHDAAQSVDVVAQHGRDHGLIATLAMTWADTERGRGSVGTAIRSGRTSFVRHIASDPNAAPWRGEILARGYRSVVSLPLRVEDAVIGTFSLFAPEPDAFDAEEIELLDEMAADLSFGIETIRERARGREAERAIEHAATHNALTDLPNRDAFLRRTGEALRAAAAHGEPVTVLVGHLSHLQELYDGLGFDPGNRVIGELARRLRPQTEGEELLGHLQLGDFGLLLPTGDAARAQVAALEMRRALIAPVSIGDAQIEVQAAVGASFYPGHGDEPELLVRRATITAREAARRDLPYLAYKGATARENPARLALASDLHKAIDARALTLHYQVKQALRERDGAGAEALVRWRHPERGTVSPVEFIPVAEQTGLIRPLTYLVVDLAVRQLRAWNEAGTPVAVAVNLSARNLYDPQLLPWIDGLLNTWGVPGKLLDYEITESALIEDPDGARKALQGLAELGGKIYIDDFGTGYSSLNYLVTLPVHALKIDRSFVARMAKSAPARAVVQSVISMAHALELRVVAEGVETEAEAEILRQFGCDQGQGYLFGRPIAPEDFAARPG